MIIFPFIWRNNFDNGISLSHNSGCFGTRKVSVTFLPSYGKSTKPLPKPMSQACWHHLIGESWQYVKKKILSRTFLLLFNVMPWLSLLISFSFWTAAINHQISTHEATCRFECEMPHRTTARRSCLSVSDDGDPWTYVTLLCLTLTKCNCWYSWMG